jgi:hypothetical protein
VTSVLVLLFEDSTGTEGRGLKDGGFLFPPSALDLFSLWAWVYDARGHLKGAGVACKIIL